MNGAFAAFFEAGSCRTVRSSTPLTLDEHSMFLVGKGKFHLFLSPVFPGGNGRRQFITSLSGGVFIPPCASLALGDDAIYIFLLVPVADGELFSQPAGAFAKLAALAPDETAERIDLWLKTLYSDLTVGAKHLPAGKEPQKQLTILKPGRNLFSGASPCWVRIVEGGAFYCGEETFPPAIEGSLFALTPKRWLTAQEECVVECRSTSEKLAEGSLPEALRLTHFHLIRCLLFSQLCRVRDRSLDEKYEQRKTEAEIRELLHGIERLVAATPPPPAAKENATERAIGILMKKYHLPLRHHPLAEPSCSGAERQLLEYARLNQWRFRKIMLKPGFERTHGALLFGFSRQGRAPRLLYLEGKRSKIFDPESGSTIALSAETARTVAGYAYEFSESFPLRPLTVKDIFRFLRSGSSGLWAVILSAGVLAGILGTAFPVAIGYTAGWLAPAGISGISLGLAVLLIGFAFAQIMLFMVPRVLLLTFGTRQFIRFETALFDRLFRLPMDFFRRFSSGDLCFRLLTAERIRQALSDMLIHQFTGAVLAGASLVVMFICAPLPAAAALLLGLIYAVTALRLHRRLMPYLAARSAAEGRQAGFLKQAVDGIVKIQGAGAERRITRHFLKDFAIGHQNGFHAASRKGILSIFASALPLAGNFSFFLLFHLIPETQPGVGAMLTLLTAGNLYFFSVGQLFSSLGVWAEAKAECKRLEPFFSSGVESAESKPVVESLDGSVALSRITFRYVEDGRPVLHDVSLHAEPGEFIAIVGPSGAGKSSLVRLLLGFETPESGSVLYNGNDLREQDVESVRSHLGVILQNSRVLPGTILDNIVTGTFHTLEDALKAIEIAGLAEDVAAMPMGVFTRISEDLLSGGQCQRIMIARAVAGDPAVLILDESTSALDNECQEKIRKNLEKLHCTRIAIAHRISTVMNADRIYVLDHGKIVQQGGYSELLEAPGLFRDMAMRQLS